MLRSVQQSIQFNANQCALVSTMLAPQYSVHKVALDTAVNVPKIAIQITVLDHLDSARATAYQSIIHAEVRTILKCAWPLAWLVCNRVETASTYLATVAANQNIIAASQHLDHKFAGNIGINALQCVILNADFNID